MSRGFSQRRAERARPPSKHVGFVLGYACVALAASCSDGDAQRGERSSAAEEPDGVYLRLRNASSVSFDDITVSVGVPIEFGALPAGGESTHLPANGIYSYAYIEATSSEGVFTYQPTDYVGETPLEPGYYTYGLSIMLDETGQQGGWFDIQLFRDRPPK
jgi:hypothetical protein